MIGTILGLAVKSRYAERTTSGRMAECEKKTKSFQLLASELRVQPCREDLNWSTVGIVCRIIDELVVERKTLFLPLRMPQSLLLRREQRMDESIRDNRDRDHDINAQKDQQGQNPPAQVTARERAHCRSCELIWFKRADQRGIVLQGTPPICPTGSGRL
jgi:hypothetical protein